MKKFKIALVLFFLNIYTIHGAEISFSGPQDLKPANLGLNAYFYFHNLARFVFKPLGLDTMFTLDESSRSLIALSNLISFEHPVYMVIENYKGKSQLILSFKLEKKQDSTFLIVNSNYIITEKKFTNKFTGNEFGTMFYINKNKITYFKHHYDAATEAELKKEDENLALADYYLNNDNFDDDKLILPILEKLILDNKTSQIQKYAAILIKGQMFMVINDIENADKLYQTAVLEVKNVGEDAEKARYLLNSFNHELNIMKFALDLAAKENMKAKTK